MTTVGRVGTNFRQIQVDVLLACVLTTLSLITTAHTSGDDGIRPAAGALAALTVAPVALRRVAPVATMTVIMAAELAYSVLGYGDFPNAGAGLLVAMFTVATLCPRTTAAVLCGAMATLTVVVYETAVTPPAWSEVMQAVLVTIVAWMLGRATRSWAREAGRAAARERARIARELHDVVAHHMSVVSLQAGLAGYVMDNDAPTARKAIATVGDSSREALTELRRLLDVLRVDDDDVPASTPPRAAEHLTLLEELVRRTRDSGLPTELTITGERRALPPDIALCLHRVAQESLTNTLKHAGPGATARVTLDHGERTVTLTVTDTGTATVTVPAPAGQPGSYGIRGMRERAALHGGELTAGPRAGGGFEVRLRLPAGVLR
ncbi:sensor histidine kinase [Streptomyces xiamenensis]|uniref:sensor histidine kinase n=1 Tax=Streptomyces xiamenensis TaxID=408015 RepID=UPI0037CE5F33